MDTRTVVDRLGSELQLFSLAAADAFEATAALESGADVPRLKAALDVVSARLVELQRAVESYRALADMAERGWRQRQTH